MSEITEIITAIASMSAVGAIIFGIFQYKKDQINKKKDILFPLIEEFDDDCKKMDLAKKLLDEYKYKLEGGLHSMEEGYYYRIENEAIFRHHVPGGINDPRETEVRESFDALLDFFGKIGYLLDVGLLNKKEIGYFEYYINKASKSKSVGTYITNYDFPLYRKLLLHLGLKQN